MLLTAALVVLAPTALLHGLRNGWYALHLLIVLAIAWWLQRHYSFPAFHTITFAYAAAIHLIVINLVTFSLYGWDKRAAKHGRWRVPERTLHDFALIGGTLGAVTGSKIFRHKTIKNTFRRRFWLIVVIQIMAVLAGAYWLTS